MNLKKIIGSVLVTGALFVSAVPAHASDPVKPGDLTPIRNKHKGYEYNWLGYNSQGIAQVRVWFRDDDGDSYYRTFDCIDVINGTCYVYK
ncbi:hypothetical protein QNH25_05880 [Bacillus safensis]|uniref:hypothetical protein n=1 Tax=Bacillus TaxID=1386 RepID=UPI0004220C0A|nr:MULTISPECIES: hypothetical protein [Bacillus]APJ10506.1 hypothetical protein BSL056_05890 [Bacillus safensis]MBI1628509.1 hypothetical protein [Bacillus safensis]MEC1413295.1 hypothetical protein [Bacillus safensis]MED4592715.1 hypothetical protein [Bacillus safensis]MED4638470.1 hypothetical protein [Bacillus safensis]